MIRIFWIINSRLLKGFSVTIYPFFFSIVKLEKSYQNQGRESANSQMCFQHVYSCFIIYIKGQKNQCTKQKRTESMVSSFSIHSCVLSKKGGCTSNFVSEINWNQNSIHRYMKFVYAIYTMQMCSTKKRKNFFFATFLGHQTF